MGKLRFAYLPLNKIEVSLSNVRKSKLEEGIDELVDSIRSIGVQQPVMVVDREGEEKYQLIIGQRRYLACQRLKLTEIPAIIIDDEDETDLIIKSFSENIHRRDLEQKDKTRIAKILLDKYKKVSKVANVLGVSNQTIRNWLGFSLVSDEMKEMVDEEKISASTATMIAKKIPDPKKALEIAEKVRETPRSEDKHKLIEVAKENPEKSTEEVVEIIKELEFTKIIIYVTPRYASALKRATQAYSSEEETITKEDIAKEALEEWLTKRGFIE